MGFFNNVLPLSFQVDPSLRFGEFMRYVKQELIAVMSHQQIPFERLVSEPEFVERAQGVGLYQALFSFQDARERPRDIGGLAHRQMHLPQRGATDDLGIWLMDKPQRPGRRRGLQRRHLPARDRRRLQGALHGAAAPGGPAAGRDAGGDLLAGRLGERGLPAAPGRRRGTGAHRSRDRGRAAGAGTAGAAPARAGQAGADLGQRAGIDVNDIRANDNFFDLGGDSLLAMRVVQQAEQVMGFRVEPRRYVFESLGQLASAAAGTAIEAASAQAADSGAKRGGLLGRVLGLGPQGLKESAMTTVQLPSSMHCRLWQVDLDATPAPQAVASLSEAEWERARRFVFKRDRNRFIAAHAALRETLSAQCGIPASMLEFALGPFGKPEPGRARAGCAST